ncbi:MAG: hypothetical protein QM736_26470 [Vicinamibacterales bacterium]
MTISRIGLRLLFITAAFIVIAWPPTGNRSLLVKAVNWGLDPRGTLPVLPPQLGFGLSDDPQAVEMRDELVRRYDDLYNRDALTRRRLELKVMTDPFDPTTERQLLLLLGIVVAAGVARSRDRG